MSVKNKASAPNKAAPKNNIDDDASKLRKLEDSRKVLFDLIAKFRVLLSDTALSENKTSTYKEIESVLALDITKAAWDLNFQNLDEGTMTMVSLLLHSCLLTRDELNKLKFQNAYLAKQVSSLKQQVATINLPDKITHE